MQVSSGSIAVAWTTRRRGACREQARGERTGRRNVSFLCIRYLVADAFLNSVQFNENVMHWQLLRYVNEGEGDGALTHILHIF